MKNYMSKEAIYESFERTGPHNITPMTGFAPRKKKTLHICMTYIF
jgi:hypothetical protein